MTAPTTDQVTLHANPAPGPGGRFARGAAQLGGAAQFVDLWHAFGWFGADGWTADQAAVRWPAIFGATAIVIGGAHNLFNWWRSERRSPVDSVVVSAEPAPPDHPPAPTKRR